MAEVNGLNHYIGMMPLEDAARLERALAPYGVAGLGLLAALAALVRRRWTALLSLAIVAFPVVFLADLAFWLWYYGHHLDPTAPLRAVIKPFTPPVLGVGRVGQFVVVADFGPGLYLAFAAALLAAAGVVMRWRALSQAGKAGGGF